MSEKIKINIESSKDKYQNNDDSFEIIAERAEKHEHHRPTNNLEKKIQLEKLRSEVNKESKPNTESLFDKSETESEKTPQGPINKELKSMMRQRTLNRVRKDLPITDRILSKIVHSKYIETASAFGEKTIARPIGLFGGGLFALIGSLVTFYMAKHYGFKYNLLLFFLLFFIGYILVTLIELIFIASKKIRN